MGFDRTVHNCENIRKRAIEDLRRACRLFKCYPNGREFKDEKGFSLYVYTKNKTMLTMTKDKPGSKFPSLVCMSKEKAYIQYSDPATGELLLEATFNNGKLTYKSTNKEARKMYDVMFLH